MPQTDAFSFDALEELRRSLRRLLRGHKASLNVYFDEDSGGFYHRIAPDEDPVPGDFSKASSATVVNFLMRSGYWDDGPWSGGETRLAEKILEAEWDSAELGPYNEFTTGFLLEALHTLQAHGAVISESGKKKIDHAIGVMNVSLEQTGGIALQAHPEGGAEDKPDRAHPENGYLTHLVVRALLKWHGLRADAAIAAQQWAARNLDRELVISRASPANADLFEIAYSVLILKGLEENWGVLGDIVIERDIIRHSVDVFFDGQLKDGTWPRSRPLFHYPNVGNAYCFEYELLVQMLAERKLWPQLLTKLPKLKTAVEALENRKYPTQPNVFAWSSGHHRQFKEPESWSTASVFHFCYELDRLAAEAVRRVVFSEVGGEYMPPAPSHGGEDLHLSDKLLDTNFRHKGAEYSLRQTIEDLLLKPIAREISAVSHGRAFSKETPISAILYGPPGTSKTQIARHIADAIGWPLLQVDPSYLVRNGLENIQSETNRLFSWLLETSEVVVLFDEIDELVRERGVGGEVVSRLLTTSMLPKWAALSERRQIVYLVATNHLEVFDIAISRPGRFDMIVPVNPPSAQAKLGHWTNVKAKLEELGQLNAAPVLEALELLTFDEFSAVADELAESASVEQLGSRLERISSGALLKRPVTPEAQPAGQGDWKSVIDAQESKIRLPKS